MWLAKNFFTNPEDVAKELKSFWHQDESKQKIFDEFSENTLSNYFLPFGVVPNMLIDDRMYCVPMVIEESSVVAAASSAAKFWLDRGGITTTIVETRKVGQVHFMWHGPARTLINAFPTLQKDLIEGTAFITTNMQKRGGGVLGVELVDMTHLDQGYYQLKAEFETCDSMGANFINSVLEEFARILTNFIQTSPLIHHDDRKVQVIMSILSNYTPDCIVRAMVECPIKEMGSFDGMDAHTFAYKFEKAVHIAHLDVHRATTHNKGIYNGVDAVALATGNDFRAIEACGHTYAARDGQYRSLSYCEVKDGMFRFWLDLPLAVGTVGGLTTLHPLARRAMELLGQPSARELMSVIASTGLCQNFAALRSLVTTGIQKGHMKMHLMNILNHLEATEKEVSVAVNHFSDKLVSFTAVRDYLDILRQQPQL